jgi:hypothetical protein
MSGSLFPQKSNTQKKYSAWFFYNRKLSQATQKFLSLFSLLMILFFNKIENLKHSGLVI